MWSKMIHPSDNLVIIGEAASPYYAWAFDALESVVHGIHAWLGLNIDKTAVANKAITILETDDPNIPLVGLPPYVEPNMSA